jgi:ABC-type enterochelin transport system substrate-binding protein
MQGAQISDLAQLVIMDLPEKPACIDIAKFDAIAAASTNWTTAGSNQVMRQVASTYKGEGVGASRSMDYDSLALLWAVQVRRHS